MCQVCALKKAAERDRWPKPLQPTVNEIFRLVATVHQEHDELNKLRALEKDWRKSGGESNDVSPNPEEDLEVAHVAVNETVQLLDAALKNLSNGLSNQHGLQKYWRKSFGDSTAASANPQADIRAARIPVAKTVELLEAALNNLSEGLDKQRALGKTWQKSGEDSTRIEINPKDDLDEMYATITTTVELLTVKLSDLSEGLGTWWNSPEKISQRRRWIEECESESLRKSNVINVKCKNMVNEMEAILGRFARWNLGIVSVAENIEALNDDQKTDGETAHLIERFVKSQLDENMPVAPTQNKPVTCETTPAASTQDTPEISTENDQNEVTVSVDACETWGFQGL